MTEEMRLAFKYKLPSYQEAGAGFSQFLRLLPFCL